MTQKLLSGNLQKKAVSLLSVILFLILGVNTAVLTGVGVQEVQGSNAVKERRVGGHAEGARQGIGPRYPIESLQDVNTKLVELADRDKAIGYAMVMEAKGKILFHNQQGQIGKEMNDATTTSILASKRKPCAERRRVL